MRVPSLMLLLAVLAGCGSKRSGLESALSPADRDRFVQVYADSVFGYCDAAYLGAYWGLATYDAKARIGWKLEQGQKAELFAQQDRAYHDRDEAETHCSFYEAGFQYSDAEVLGQLWGLEPWEAKKLVETRIARGEQSSLYDELKFAQDKMGFDDTTHLETKSEAFSYCDIRMIASTWGPDTPLDEVKDWVDLKFQNDAVDFANEAVEAARSTGAVRCEWWEVPYSYDHAAVVAEAWSLSIEEAKAAMAQKYTTPAVANIQAVLGGR